MGQIGGGFYDTTSLPTACGRFGMPGARQEGSQLGSQEATGGKKKRERRREKINLWEGPLKGPLHTIEFASRDRETQKAGAHTHKGVGWKPNCHPHVLKFLKSVVSQI